MKAVFIVRWSLIAGKFKLPISYITVISTTALRAANRRKIEFSEKFLEFSEKFLEFSKKFPEFSKNS